jgi:hypothetical protein
MRSIITFACIAVLSAANAFTAETSAEKFSTEEDLGSSEGLAHVLEAGSFRVERLEKDGFVRLYDLSKDAAQLTNIANQLPGKRVELVNKLKANFKVTSDPQPRIEAGVAATDLPPHVVRPERDDVIQLHARDAEIHGATVRYEPQTNKNTIGYWTKADDWVSWDMYVPKAGNYKVEILQGCGPKSGGSVVAFECNKQRLETTVQETKHFQDFISRSIGEFQFEKPGRYTFAVRPQSKPGPAVMDLRLVTLRPAN